MYLGMKGKSLIVEVVVGFGGGGLLDCLIEKVRNDGIQMRREET
jgi:hypothetical protein